MTLTATEDGTLDDAAAVAALAEELGVDAERITLVPSFDGTLEAGAEAEVKVHKLLRHAHIARLFEVISSQASINLCMQHAAGGTLRELLDQHGALPEARARRYLRQICGALHYCHEVVHVVHRDIKLDNMLLDADDNVLLADFGFAEVVGPNKRMLRLLCGSPHYSAPEIFAQQEYVGSHVDLGLVTVAPCGSRSGLELRPNGRREYVAVEPQMGRDEVVVFFGSTLTWLSGGAVACVV